MADLMEQIKKDILQVLEELNEEVPLSAEHILVIGTSTSEVIGKKIGTSGSEGVSEVLFSAFAQFKERTGVHLAFQCCEHLNRAIVVEKETAKEFRLEEVSVIPVKGAGGSMAAHAYRMMKQAVVVETIAADAGIDIGDTLIGMHLKRVAVPLRSSIRSVGEAHVTLAKTRPKLIGGARAVYKELGTREDCF
ncbi:TIGR01440 family protein [Alkalihalobacillus sp. BA299]|uniref:TIGR01440 family protein n=1 Tax=Alkalihalobacillus sp. BA299 TaxID=2815938 RepID=UPI001ADCAE97|nr:TIGR01440 family protein [Alkalihalobacillus sp. BA299]